MSNERASDGPAAISRWLRVGLIVAGVVLLDQMTKWVMTHHILDSSRAMPLTTFLNLRLGYNTGVSFGFLGNTLRDAPYLLTALAACAGLALSFWATTVPAAWERVGLSLIAGGAFGNAIDRWRQGAVTDFIDLHWAGWHWPTFNVADIAITTGAFLIIASLARDMRGAGKPRETKPVAGRDGP